MHIPVGEGHLVFAEAIMREKEMQKRRKKQASVTFLTAAAPQ